VATQLSVIRGDTLLTQTINLTSATDDFTGLICSGQIRAHPDGYLLHSFNPTVVYAAPYSGSVYFSIPSSVTQGFPPINLYGDIHFYATGILDQTLFQFRLDVSPNVTHP
jgi:hypothetical protein